MAQLYLNDGQTSIYVTGAGASGGYLWIYGVQTGMIEVVQLFGDPARTSKITVRYDSNGTADPDVFDGYTKLEAVMVDDSGFKICLKGEN